jgi:hypothetical protein
MSARERERENSQVLPWLKTYVSSGYTLKKLHRQASEREQEREGEKDRKRESQDTKSLLSFYLLSRPICSPARLNFSFYFHIKSNVICHMRQIQHRTVKCLLTNP